MAECEVISEEPSGYPNTMFSLSIDQKYMCSQCKRVLRDPLQCFCGHRFCRQCLYDVARQPEPVTCSSCQLENNVGEYSILGIDQCFPDNALKREMFTLPVTCPYNSCKWKGSLKQYAFPPTSHQDTCTHRTFLCECGQNILVSHRQSHKDNSCMASGSPCPYCATPVPLSLLQTHNNTCPKFPLACGRCNKVNIARDAMLLHLHTDCPGLAGRCQFGCTEEVSQADMENHLATNISGHLNMMGARMLEIDGVLRSHNIPLDPGAMSIQPSIADIEKRVRDIESTATHLPSVTGDQLTPDGNTHELLLKVATFERIVTVLRDEQERCINLIEQAQLQRNSDSRRLEPLEVKVATHERELEVRDAKINELETRLAAQELISYDGHLIWKITDMSKRRREAISMSCTSIYSPPFYTHRTGYKMCTRLYPNGDGMGKDKYVSLFFVVMRGPYDALLPWPFRQKVTFMLLDQTGRDHVVDAFRPDPSSSSFRRPISEMNIASGCPMFVKLDELDRMAENYVKDDVLFIKIIVAPLEG